MNRDKRPLRKEQLQSNEMMMDVEGAASAAAPAVAAFDPFKSYVTRKQPQVIMPLMDVS